MTKIAIIVGSTRPGRNAEAVACWVYELAKLRRDCSVELVDIQDFNLPLLDEPLPPLFGQYEKPHTLTWSARVATFDGFVFVTPEYNHSVPGALKNAVDFLYREWNDKAAGVVSYGATGGTRAVDHLRLMLAELQVATVRAEVNLSLGADFEDYTHFKPLPERAEALTTLLDQVVAWAGAMKSLRGDSNATARAIPLVS
jgi:NAD(P)H-dependent FMN reductase